eukprot:TRINITY_DN5531_c0_g1_i1.p1 TRINITY_DN5531_c0_g1~~TRINITY_DN5531_c0_g1_i1.p1  ORF type:complete len:464 (-),score=81.15 TRINITY_DN5531_c0_g1_i1:304-1620(-)
MAEPESHISRKDTPAPWTNKSAPTLPDSTQGEESKASAPSVTGGGTKGDGESHISRKDTPAPWTKEGQEAVAMEARDMDPAVTAEPAAGVVPPIETESLFNTNAHPGKVTRQLTPAPWSRQEASPSVKSTITSTQFRVPTKYIKSQMDLDGFFTSETFAQLWSFVERCNKATEKITNTQTKVEQTEIINNLVAMLDKMTSLLDDTPCLEQPSRFGNKAFRHWFEKIAESAEALVIDVLPAELREAALEISTYLLDSIGNYVRIDYGTGHETTFVSFLCCLDLLGVFTANDYTNVVVRVFRKYIDMMRKVQKKFMLEPAGSHGVWSLDDYQFLPFLWGSAQLFDHPTIQPTSILEKRVYDDAKLVDDYQYIAAIQYIHQCKTGPFMEHSNVLGSIAQCPHWQKINQGMFKMYKAEVLGKVPVMQHFLFGSILAPPLPAE